MHASPNRQSGFSLIELLTTLVVVAILIAVAAPSYREAQLQGQATSQANDFVIAVTTARAEAVKLSQPVRVSALGTWDAGWIVATDANSDGAINGTDIEIQRGVAANPTFNWTVVGNATSAAVLDLRFDGQGRLVAPAEQVLFTLRRADGVTAQSRRLCVGLSGRVQTFKGEAGSCT